MAVIDLPSRRIRTRIAYCGPAGGGKTTTLRRIAEMVPPAARGALPAIAQLRHGLDDGIRRLAGGPQVDPGPGQEHPQADRFGGLRGSIDVGH